MALSWPKKDDDEGLEGVGVFKRQDQNTQKEREQGDEGLIVGEEEGDEWKNKAARSGREADMVRKAGGTRCPHG